ncbi:hypothetical protein C8F04DRAFT_1391350 [Mycena alexandri]|uniref:Secreted protein n=1 Tax=Mycena alexandri TaxID=1745969 RepID=A0AAD6T853_9AGAR|nr:hypothetical protein C8F04DRAFT_1391350 [Mycena alexandri]
MSIHTITPALLLLPAPLMSASHNPSLPRAVPHTPDSAALVSPSNPAFLQRALSLTLASVQPLTRKHLRHDDAWNVHEEDGMGAERRRGRRTRGGPERQGRFHGTAARGLVPALLGICSRSTVSRAVSPLPTHTALPLPATPVHRVPGALCAEFAHVDAVAVAVYALCAPCVPVSVLSPRAHSCHVRGPSLRGLIPVQAPTPASRGLGATAHPRSAACLLVCSPESIPRTLRRHVFTFF